MRWKLVIRSAALLIGLAGLLYIGGYALEWHRARIASAFIEQLRHREAGKTTEAQIKSLAEQYGGKYAEAHQENGILQPAGYAFGISVPYALIASSARTLPGRRFWGLMASLEVEHGYLSNLYLSLTVYRSDDFELRSTVRLNSTRRPISVEGAPYYVYEAHITGPPGEAIGVELRPAASTEERRKAFDLNLSCLTAIRECRHVCDTFPSVWNDLTPRDRLTYVDGTPVNDYRECRKGTR